MLLVRFLNIYLHILLSFPHGLSGVFSCCINLKRNLVLTETLKLWTQAAQIASSCLPVGESSSSRREDRTQSVGGKRNVLVFSKHSDSHICIEALFSVRPLGKSKRWVLDVPVCWMLVDQACILGFHSHVRNLHLLLLKRRIVLTKSLPNLFQKKTSQDCFQMIGISKYFGPINTSSVEFHIDADGADTGRMCSSLGLQPGGEEAVGKAR